MEPRREHIFGEARPHAQCHASTVAHLGGERFSAAWFGGLHENNPDVAIWGASRGADGWSEPVRLAKVKDEAHWNPVLFNPGDGTLQLYFKVGLNPRCWTTWQMASTDDGRTWSEPAELVPGDSDPRGPVKNKPIVLSDGSWLAPSAYETEAKRWDVFVDRSTDGGVTWQRTEYFARGKGFDPNEGGAIQPTLWESAPGRLHLLCRSSYGKIARADSEDNGVTWSPLYLTDLPNNNSGIDLATLPDGRLVLVYNPVEQNWGARTPLTVALSEDNGSTWPEKMDLETEPGEYSYPSVVPTGGDRFAIVYTWKRQRVAFACLAASDLG